jgi:hypothetical protein
MNDMSNRTPWHLWVVGVVSLLWNAFGGYDFVMSVTRGEAYWRESGMTDAMVDYYTAMPAWMYAPWILGVWGAVLGSILLLLRNRLAVWAFAASVLGAVVSLIYGLMNPMPPLPEAMQMMSYMPWVIVIVAAFLAWYAWSQKKSGVLR